MIFYCQLIVLEFIKNTRHIWLPIGTAKVVVWSLYYSKYKYWALGKDRFARFNLVMFDLTWIWDGSCLRFELSKHCKTDNWKLLLISKFQLLFWQHFENSKAETPKVSIVSNLEWRMDRQDSLLSFLYIQNGLVFTVC